jgi:hypothetical protein
MEFVNASVARTALDRSTRQIALAITLAAPRFVLHHLHLAKWQFVLWTQPTPFNALKRMQQTALLVRQDFVIKELALLKSPWQPSSLLTGS